VLLFGVLKRFVCGAAVACLVGLERVACCADIVSLARGWGCRQMLEEWLIRLFFDSCKQLFDCLLGC
jgi:hypothetical protein